ncbi:MAG: adenylate/guanylate cyclase domain-containing protein [Alphaproteobacteria bacterium]|nr:adenylate/guanylate cyclase domain-containing protein [Alphaproteobacteria bacterium]
MHSYTLRMAEGTQRRLAAIVSADVVGYSRLMGVDETGTLDALRAHRNELIDAKIAEHGGRIVKTMGDGLLLEFPSVVDAIQCVIDVQQTMAKRNEAVDEDKRIVFRIGVHLGDLVVEGDDIFGDGINVAARLEAFCQAGGVAISGTAHENIAGRIEVGFVDAGDQQLKNIARPVRVWQWTPTASPIPATGETLPLPNKPSIAVLAFDNMSGDPEQEYFADGIAEDIITALSRFHQFHVIARNSSFTYKGQAVNIGQAGQELGAQYIVEGSVRKAGNRVRVTAQMIEANSGRHVWADRYDGQLEDIFDLQDNITNTIAGAIWPAMTKAELDRASRKPPESFDSWELTLQGYRTMKGSPEEVIQARVLAEKALALDPRNTEALVLLSRTHTVDGWMGYTQTPDVSFAKGIATARQAMQIDASNALSLAYLGMALFGDRQHDEGLDCLSQAVKKNPNQAENWTVYGMCLGFSGQFQDAIEAYDKASRLSPRDARYGVWMSQLAIAAFVVGQHEVGAEYGRLSVLNAPNFPGGHRSRAANLVELGQMTEARREIAEIHKLAPTMSVASTRAGMPFRHDEARERYCNALAKAGLPLE